MSNQAERVAKQRIEQGPDGSADFEATVEAIQQECDVAEKTAASYIYKSAELEHEWVDGEHIVREAPDEPDQTSQTVLGGFNGKELEREPGDPTGKKHEELEVLEPVDHPKIPEPCTYYRSRVEGHKSDVQMIERDLSDDTPKGAQNVMLQGPPGVGKNLLVKHVCAETNRAHIRIPVGAGIRYEDLVGHYTPTADGELEWKDGLLTTAVRYGFVVVLDEIDMASGDVTSPLHQITEDHDDRQLVIRQTGEVIDPHPEFRVVATKNENLAGAKPMNDAFKSRFSWIDMGFPSPNREQKIVAAQVDGLDEADIKDVCEFVGDLRARYPTEFGTPVTTREVERIGGYIADGFLNEKAALRKVLLPLMDEEDEAPLEDEIDMKF